MSSGPATRARRAADQPEANADPRRRWRTLPARIPVGDTIESHDPLPAADPTMGRDPERDFLLRNAG